MVSKQSSYMLLLLIYNSYMLNIDLSTVPHKPGVYLWKDAHNNIIYVGKAKDLNNRMKQYFKGMLNSYKTAKLVDKISSFEYIITSSDKEALILERNLIEKHVPEFNIKLMDDKRYPYIKVKNSVPLEVSLVYRIRQDRDKAIFYGPFPTGYGAKRMANLVQRLTTYKDGLPNKSTDPIFWQEQFSYAKKLLSSKSKSLIKELEERMLQAAENMQFEIANDIKQTIEALRFYQDKQTVEFLSDDNVDVLGFVEQNGFLSVTMLFYRQGTLLSKNERIVEITEDKKETIRQFVSQYYGFNIKPDYIISNEEIETEIEVIIPQKGDKKKILEIALENANDNVSLKLQTYVRKEELTLGAMSSLAKLLGLKNLNHFLMIDNSNTNNTQPVSAIVSYRNGIKQKQEYRKYNLEINSRKADVDYMKQGVIRYFENHENVIPDLFIVDGGKAQINEVKKVAPKDLKIIGLVKNDKHITEAIIDLNGNRIQIEDQNLMNFLKGVQVEVDRFAKASHIKRRQTTLEGLLASVEGIGPSTEKKLLAHFETYSAIYNASLEELKQVVSEKIAKNIIKAMKGE